jgi:hypothetical protein
LPIEGIKKLPMVARWETKLMTDTGTILGIFSNQQSTIVNSSFGDGKFREEQDGNTAN